MTEALTDPELNEVVRTGILPPGATLQELAFELVRARERLRGESRKAQQLRKMRWNVEHLLTKIEDIAAEDGAIARDTAEAIAKWVLGYQDEPMDSRLVAAGIRDGKWR